MNDDNVQMFENKEFREYQNMSYQNYSKITHIPPIDDDFIAKLEWGLMLLNNSYSNVCFSEAVDQYSIKTFDGAWLINAGKIGKGNMIFALSDDDLNDTLKIVKDIKMKWFSLDEVAAITQVKFLTDKEKRPLLSKNRFIASMKRGIYQPDKEKWFLHDVKGFGFDKLYPDTTQLFRLEEMYDKLFDDLIKKEEDVKKQNLIDKMTSKSFYDLLVKDGFNFGKPYPSGIALKPGYYIKQFEADKYIAENIGMHITDLKEINMAISLSLTSYFEWFVYIRENDKSLGIKIPIHPESSKDVFALRNLQTGDKRRKAICNYVKQHYRVLHRDDYDKEQRITLVKKHLRGETKFNWRGLQVNVIPSLDDINLLNPKKKFLDI